MRTPVHSRVVSHLLLACMIASVAVADEPPPAMTSAIARDVIDRVIPEVEALRGLQFKRPVSVEVVDDARLREYILARVQGFEQRQHLERVEAVYEGLGLVPSGTELLQTVIEVMEEQAGGFYDPSSGSYYLLDDVPSATAAIFTAHELTHALEDQHFDLDERLESVLDDDDRMLAVSAVHEGTATVLMTTYTTRAVLRGELDPSVLMALAETEAGRAEKLSALPPVLVRQLLGPYVLGASFLTRGNLLAAAAGFPVEAAARAMRDGPTSSEQILHPEKFWDERQRDNPLTLPVSDAGRSLGKRWKPDGDGVLGELTLGVLVGAQTPSDPQTMTAASAWTNEAAAGWAGDRWELWRGKDGASVVLLQTAWDTEADAREFADALPARASLHWRREGSRVAIVAGDVGEKAPTVMLRMLEPASPKE